jgi:hypothetical protein
MDITNPGSPLVITLTIACLLALLLLLIKQWRNTNRK